jgi:hypothetical protein
MPRLGRTQRQRGACAAPDRPEAHAQATRAHRPKEHQTSPSGGPAETLGRNGLGGDPKFLAGRETGGVLSKHLGRDSSNRWQKQQHIYQDHWRARSPAAVDNTAGPRRKLRVVSGRSLHYVSQIEAWRRNESCAADSAHRGPGTGAGRSLDTLPIYTRCSAGVVPDRNSGHVMMPSPRPIIAEFDGLHQGLSRSLSSFDIPHHQTGSATAPIQLCRLSMEGTSLAACQFTHSARCHRPRKAIQYP